MAYNARADNAPLNIEDGFEIPPAQRHLNIKEKSLSRLKLEKMTPGQSVLVRERAQYTRLLNTTNRIKKDTPGTEYTSRRLGPNRWRIWRIK